ncbi:hypothetical protein [Nesterenkonia marinintestina]|uniref:hypothetical protein n=1 Tax=Nesterenkonia marinintestina TaxID=2979865 RepID=UPI0021BF34AB|nr:hypothetical protein [Nesterenkonia sp. GX14115]
MRDDQLPIAEFGAPGPMRDALVAAILSGEKTTTSSRRAHEEYWRSDQVTAELGGSANLDDDTPVVLERLRLRRRL